MDKVLHYVSIMDRAGEETFIMNVFRKINRSQIMFDFLVTENQTGDYDNEIHLMGGVIHHLQLIKKGGSSKRVKNFFILKEKLKLLCKEYKTFHIHTHHAMDAVLDSIAAKLAGFKTVIVHSHSTSTPCHLYAHYIFRPFLKYLPIIRLACSDKAGNWLFGQNGAFEIINNGIDTDNFLFNIGFRSLHRKTEGWENKLIIGHVGRFSYPKNHSFLIEIFKEFQKISPDSLLVLVGKGELMEQIKNKAFKLGVIESIRFLGGRNDVNELYSSFDVLVFPSFYEGLPISLVEAQSADLPCLVSDVITEQVIINSNLKRLSLDKSAREWAYELSQLAHYTSRRNCKHEIEMAGFDISKTVERLSSIYLA